MLKLEKNIVRINGYKNGKRSHVDVPVRMTKVVFASGGVQHEIDAPAVYEADIPELGFKNGLEGVTSYNYYNWVGKHRITCRIW